MYEWADELGFSRQTVHNWVAQDGSRWYDNYLRNKQKRESREQIPAGHPGSLSWEEIPWEDDVHAQYVVAAHPKGLGLREIGDLMGFSHENVRLIEEQALRKLKRGLEMLEKPAATPRKAKGRDWSRVDWAKSDREIAKDMRVDRHVVWKMRVVRTAARERT